jgi:hypothetical protein
MADVPLNMALDNIEFGTLVVDAEGIVTFNARFSRLRRPFFQACA